MFVAMDRETRRILVVDRVLDDGAERRTIVASRTEARVRAALDSLFDDDDPALAAVGVACIADRAVPVLARRAGCGFWYEGGDCCEPLETLC